MGRYRYKRNIQTALLARVVQAVTGLRNLNLLAGIATNWVVESTTRYGAEPGYDITVLEDCCQGFSDELRNFAIKETLPYYATIMKSKDFIAALG